MGKLKFEAFSHDSASASQAQPPFGAPTGHFGDLTDNIQREALAAVNDIGQAVFGNSLNESPHNPGNLPQIQPANDLTSADVNQLSQLLAQMVYDQTWVPLRDVRALATAGLADAPAVNAAIVPAGVSATWQPCDGFNGTPDLREIRTDSPTIKRVLAGGDPFNTRPGNPGALHTGDTGAAGKTNENNTGLTETGGAFSVNVVAHGHDHTIVIPAHDHTGAVGTVDIAGTGGQGAQSDFVITVGTTDTGDQPDTNATGGVTDVVGDETTHTHPINDFDSIHDHVITGLPPRTALEYWMRTS